MAPRRSRTCGRRAGAGLRLLVLLRTQDVRADRHRRALRQSALLESMPPYQGGGDMISSVTFERTATTSCRTSSRPGRPYRRRRRPRGGDRLPHRDRFNAIAASSSELLAYATAPFGGLPGRPAHRHGCGEAGVLSFLIEGVHPHDIGTILDREGRGDPHGPPLLPAADGSARRSRHGARLVRAVQHSRRTSTRSRPLRRPPATASDDADLGALYHFVIVDHSRHPRHFAHTEAGRRSRAAIRSAAIG